MTQPTVRIPLPEEQPLIDMWPDAAGFVGMARATAYTHAQNGTFPVEVVHIGGRLKVRTSDLRRFLGLKSD